MNELNSPTTDHPEEFVGNTLGKYEITQYIGRGGFGTVYLARHTKLGTTRVLKILNDTTTTIITEARKQAAVQHPNIVRIDDVEDETTPNYIVMEHMPDGDLTRLITQTTPDNAIEIMKQVMQGIAHIHANNYNHLDLKPTNILLAGKTAKISDFGLAKTFGDYSEKYRTTQSTTGGTPEYMPPEQTSGIIAPTNDIYSFGITFYQLLTGKLPQEVGFEDIRALNSTVPEALDVLIMKAISQSPRKRQQNAKEVIEELDKIQDDDPWTTFIPKPTTRTPNKTLIAELLQDTPDDADFIADIQTEPDTFSDLLAIPAEPTTYDENPTANHRKGLDELPDEFQNRIGTKEEPVPNPTIIVPTRSTTLGGIKVYEHDAAIVRQIIATAGRKNLNGIGISNADYATEFDTKPLIVVKDNRIVRLSLTGIPITTISDIPELTELIELNINGTRVTDLSPLAITGIERLHAHLDIESLVPILLMEKLAELKYAYDKEDDAILKALPRVKVVKGFDIGERPKYRPTAQITTEWPHLQIQNGKPNFRGILGKSPFELTITARHSDRIAGTIETIATNPEGTKHSPYKTYIAGTINQTQLDFTQIFQLFLKEYAKIKFVGTKQDDNWTGTFDGKINGQFEMREA